MTMFLSNVTIVRLKIRMRFQMGYFDIPFDFPLPRMRSTYSRIEKNYRRAFAETQ